MDDIFAQFLRILIAVAMGMAISCYSGLYKRRGLEWAIAIVCLVTYLIVRMAIPLRLFTHGIPASASNSLPSSGASNSLPNGGKLAPGGSEWDWVHGSVDPIRVPQVDMPKPGLPKDKFTKYGTTKYPVMGPLDNLTEKESSERLQYLADVTRTPYRAKSYLKWRTDSDARRTDDGSPLVSPQDKQPEDYAVEYRRWRPDTTNELGNARDCTAYEPGHPFSCIQEWPAGNQPAAQEIGPILDHATRCQLETFTNLDEEPLKVAVADEYRRVHSERPIMWRNAPGKVGRNSTHHSWHDMCRNCKVGKCLNGICGSRLIEPEDDNILGASKLIRDYMRADKPLR